MTTLTARTLAGSAADLDAHRLSALEGRLNGSLLRPDDAGYEDARRIWNGMIDRRPALFIRCATTADVAEAIRFCRDAGLYFSLRGGGHNIAGTSLCDDGVVVDLSGMKRIEVDTDARTVRVQPGCTLGDVDRATQPHALAVPSGIVSETGMGGLTLGGGFGWLTRKHGYTSDNLLEAEVVLADGTVVVASEDAHADLFWGIRGGGGNFGAVTSFLYQAHPVGPEVWGGMILHPWEAAADVLAFYRDFSAGLPDEASALAVLRPAPPAPFLPPEIHGKMVVGMAGMYAGPTEEGARVFEPLTTFGEPLGGGMSPRPFLDVQTMLDAAQPKGRHYYWKSEYMSALSAETDAKLIEHAAHIASPHSAILLFQLGGVHGRIPADTSAAGHRDARWVLNVAGAWDDPGESAGHQAWVRGCWEALRPHATGGTYVNFLTADDGEDRVRSAYGASYDRLATLKAKYDPDNVFRANQNVRPAAE